MLVTVSVYVPTGVPPAPGGGGGPPPPQAGIARAAKNSTHSRAVPAPSQARRRLATARLTSITASSHQNTCGRPLRLPAMGGPRWGRGAPIARAVVVTLTVALTVAVPFKATAVGLGVQVEAGGAPLQASDTVPLKPVVPVKASV